MFQLRLYDAEMVQNASFLKLDVIALKQMLTFLSVRNSWIREAKHVNQIYHFATEVWNWVAFYVNNVIDIRH